MDSHEDFFDFVTSEGAQKGNIFFVKLQLSRKSEQLSIEDKANKKVEAKEHEENTDDFGANLPLQ